MRTVFAALSASLALALASADAGAAVLYKLVDTQGNVTFTDTLPRSFVGEVTRLDVDTGTNVFTPAPESAARAPVDHDLLARPGPSGEERLRMAAERIDAARAALEDARTNSVAEDWYYYQRNPATGASRAPRPEYLARLSRLESEVIAAEEAYDALRGELR